MKCQRCCWVWHTLFTKLVSNSACLQKKCRMFWLPDHHALGSKFILYYYFWWCVGGKFGVGWEGLCLYGKGKKALIISSLLWRTMFIDDSHRKGWSNQQERKCTEASKTAKLTAQRSSCHRTPVLAIEQHERNKLIAKYQLLVQKSIVAVKYRQVGVVRHPMTILIKGAFTTFLLSLFELWETKAPVRRQLSRYWIS